MDQEEYEIQEIDDEHFAVKEFQEGKCGWEFEDFQQLRDYDGEGTTGFAVMDTAATTGLRGEETLKKWKQAYGDYGIKDGIKVVAKKTVYVLLTAKRRYPRRKCIFLLMFSEKQDA